MKRKPRRNKNAPVVGGYDKILAEDLKARAKMQQELDVLNEIARKRGLIPRKI